ncbi:DUF5518 domain-containing protein [Natronobeatus ordinarius]|uniref:DUF5518 domain-containing protein n=1 Tax=Natronobeatus ordinarius TaxID=2963433 RepID=UPI0020CE1FFA|nr:DUF5518 domain-containing protein [Natronobeatus ordinarius]
MASRHTFVTALVGAVVGVVLSFLPFSTVIGGVVTGFLEGPDGRDATLAGALAGLIMFVPIGLFAFVALWFLGFGLGFAGLPIEGFLFLLLALGLGVSMVLVYTVGLAALGGYLGAYLAREYPESHANTRESMRMPPAETELQGRSRATSQPEPTRWHESHEEADEERLEK